MKVIDQINGSAIFAQSAYSASIATKDDLGRDITATYLTAHQSLDDYLTTADANTISSTLSGAITALSGEVPQLSAGEGIAITTADGKTVITNNISAGSNISLVYDMETNTYRIDAQGGNPFPMVSSDDSQLYSRYIYELDGLASGIKSTYTNSSNAITAISSTEVSPDKIVLQTSSDNATYPSEVIITDDKVSKLWYADTYRSKKWDDIIKPTIEWNSATDFHSIGSGAELRVWYNNGDPSASYSWSGIKLTKKYNTVPSSLFINSTGVSSYSAGGMTLPQSATWKQIIDAATGSQGKTYTGIAPIQVNNATDEISITGESLSAGPGIDMFSSGGYVVISANGGGSELPSAISAWSFNNYSQSYSHTPGNLFTETYTGSLFAPSSQWGGGPDSKPRLLLDTTVENYSGTSWVYEHGITSTGHRTTRLDDNQLYINYVVETAEDIPIKQQYTMVEPDFIRLWGSNNTGRLIELGSSGVSRSTTESATWSQIISAAKSSFPITGTNGTTGFTANMDCSSMMLTTGASPAGGYVKQTVRGVQYEAYPATDVSASWYNIINGANNRSNCYCIRFTNDMTAASLEDYSAYDKVTVVHSNEYTPDCMLYWDGNTKVFPSGLYCELVKGVNDQNQTDWFFTTSGWINNVEWDWD